MLTRLLLIGLLALPVAADALHVPEPTQMAMSWGDWFFRVMTGRWPCTLDQSCEPGQVA